MAASRRFTRAHLEARDLPGEIRIAQFFLVVLGFPFALFAFSYLIYIASDGVLTGSEATGLGIGLGGLAWFLLPLWGMSRFTLWGYWWAVATFAFPAAAALAGFAGCILNPRPGCLPAALLVALILTGTPLGLLLRGRRRYFTRLRLLSEAPPPRK